MRDATRTEGGVVQADERIPRALLLLRLSVFLVMFMWTLDKFLSPGHAAQVYSHFYRVGGLGNGVFYAIGVAELLLLVALLVGYQKRFTYGTVLVLHAVSTLAAYRQYLAPLSNLLFFAAWPMLAACFTLYTLRDLDTLWVVDSRKRD
jgi:putative oxidoreductase